MTPLEEIEARSQYEAAWFWMRFVLGRNDCNAFWERYGEIYDGFDFNKALADMPRSDRSKVRNLARTMIAAQREAYDAARDVTEECFDAYEIDQLGREIALRLTSKTKEFIRNSSHLWKPRKRNGAA